MMLSGKTNPTVQVSHAATLEHTSPADKVAANDSLLIEILLRLPVRSLLRFKSVSKHWLSLITDPCFSRRRQPFPYTPSGLILHPFCSLSVSPEIDFISLNNDDNPSDSHLKTLASFPGLPAIKILNSCNGLLCCSNFYPIGSVLKCYIYNPTTTQFVMLPQPMLGVQIHSHSYIDGLSLAFDPSNSPFYKVVCVWRIPVENRMHCQIEILSSETRHWRKSGELFAAPNMDFKGGVYWNGAINWVSFWGDSLYFNVDEERFGTLPMPPVRDGWYDRQPRYFGKSGDHLHLIDLYDGPLAAQFNVYEMNRDYSEWFVKYRVDLDGVANVFPEMIRSQQEDYNDYAFAILSIVRGEKKEEDSFMVLHVPGKVIRYNLIDKTFKKLCDVALPSIDAERDVGRQHLAAVIHLRYADYHSFEYMECLSCV